MTFSGPDGVPQDVGGTGRSETRLLTDLGESSWELIAIDRPPGGDAAYVFKRPYGTP